MIMVELGKKPNIKPETIQDTKYHIGDNVTYSSCYKSSTAPNVEAIILKKWQSGKITSINKGTKNPYLIENGRCWVNDGDIRNEGQILNVEKIQTSTFKVKVNSAVNVRIQPTTRSSLAGSKSLKAGDTFIATETVVGQNVNGNNVWYKSQKGNYVWSGCCSKI